jgi:LacI family repressor for deo operon, udp, cdd, tsx, nupC, and nupG
LDRSVEDLECDWVAVQNTAASRKLVETLMNNGARRIVWAGGRIEAATGRERLEGYRAALRGRRIAFDSRLIFRGDFSMEAGRDAADKALQLPDPPDAFFCANNRVFTGMLERFATAPKVPWAHLPVAVFDSVPFMAHLNRPLVVAIQPERGMGARGFELLLERIRSGPPGTPRMKRPFAHELLETQQVTVGF